MVENLLGNSAYVFSLKTRYLPRQNTNLLLNKIMPGKYSFHVTTINDCIVNQKLIVLDIFTLSLISLSGLSSVCYKTALITGSAVWVVGPPTSKLGNHSCIWQSLLRLVYTKVPDYSKKSLKTSGVLGNFSVIFQLINLVCSYVQGIKVIAKFNYFGDVYLCYDPWHELCRFIAISK